MALDDDSILPEARTALLDHGKRAPLCVVLFHGITNNPAQYSELAPMIHARGANVFVPRMPFHGEKDRMTNAIANLTAEILLESASEAIDIAAGLGERVAALGISMGGSLAAWFGQHRPIGLAVPVAPDFALLQLPYGVCKWLTWLFRHLPNIYFWWDPRLKKKQLPLTAYPRCSTHALMQTMRLGDDVYAAADCERQRADRIVTVLNPIDPAINNEVAETVHERWAGWKPRDTQLVKIQKLPENHDIIDPRNTMARTEIVYPKLLEVLGLNG